MAFSRELPLTLCVKAVAPGEVFLLQPPQTATSLHRCMSLSRCSCCRVAQRTSFSGHAMTILHGTHIYLVKRERHAWEGAVRVRVQSRAAHTGGLQAFASCECCSRCLLPCDGRFCGGCLHSAGVHEACPVSLSHCQLYWSVMSSSEVAPRTVFCGVYGSALHVLWVVLQWHDTCPVATWVCGAAWHPCCTPCVPVPVCVPVCVSTDVRDIWR